MCVLGVWGVMKEAEWLTDDSGSLGTASVIVQQLVLVLLGLALLLCFLVKILSDICGRELIFALCHQGLMDLLCNPALLLLVKHIIPTGHAGTRPFLLTNDPTTPQAIRQQLVLGGCWFAWFASKCVFNKGVLRNAGKESKSQSMSMNQSIAMGFCTLTFTRVSSRDESLFQLLSIKGHIFLVP